MPALTRPPAPPVADPSPSREATFAHLQELTRAAQAADRAFVLEVQRLRNEGWSLRDLAKYAQLSHTTINNICTTGGGSRWR